ncbi:hypothetical protein HYPSUDRAFT_201166 [Hypholoma sublateritium FD-334 SS-4]|uniref:Uncharacterized protein n=1 Tax=Hypholoma sublateritium (strain FD-334 SS-4) TaxID=945553 RepID=A0A0D2MJA3_HYPSF|nr:hypothetical protein HYPSUDRAFT_201166 [Hypholoma sublateritium FD-334 SS-4]
MACRTTGMLSCTNVRYQTCINEKDIETIMGALEEHVLSTDLQALSYSSTEAENPLAEFDTQYNRMKEHRKLVPVSKRTLRFLMDIPSPPAIAE